MHMFEYWGFKCMQIICFFVDDDIGGGVRGVFVSVICNCISSGDRIRSGDSVSERLLSFIMVCILSLIGLLVGGCWCECILE